MSEITIAFDKEWTTKRIKAHVKQLEKRRKLEAKLAALVAKHQAEIDVAKDLESELLRTRDASEANFERRWGYDLYFKLVKGYPRY